MILGQLFYYQKKIKTLSDNLIPANVSAIEILGLSTLSTTDFIGLDTVEIARIIKDRFASNYQKILEQDNLNFASKFWAKLTSPLKIAELADQRAEQADQTKEQDKPKKRPKPDLKPHSTFQIELFDWLKNESPFDAIPKLLDIGYLTTEIEDYACYYGLAVLHELTRIQLKVEQTSIIEDFNDPELTTAELSAQPQVLVFCSSYLAPLFANLNFQYEPISKEQEVNLHKAETQIKDNSNIKLILLVGADLDHQVEYLEKRLPAEILISTIDLERAKEKQSDSYFEKLVNKTLGVRLT